MGYYSAVHEHDDVIEWKHFLRYWPLMRGIRWIPITKASDAELWCFLWSAPENGWENNRGDLRHHRADYDVIVMKQRFLKPLKPGSRCWWDCRRFLEQIAGYWMDFEWNIFQTIFIDFMSSLGNVSATKRRLVIIDDSLTPPTYFFLFLFVYLLLF